MDGCPGMSAHARCDQIPVIWTSPAASASRAAPITAGLSAAVAPPRDMPVSALRCSRAGRPARPAAAAIWPTSPADPADRSIPAAIASSCAASGAASRHSTGAVIPARRSASASLVCTTPSQPAPAASAAVATGSWPCP